MMPTRFDWLSIRARFEAGDTISSIARTEGMPSKQAISKRSRQEGWTVIDKPPPELTLVNFDGLSETQCLVIKEVANGLPQRHAAALAGVNESTVSVWKSESPKFLNAMHAAIAVMTRTQLGKIVKSDDWRSGLAMLERHPATREEFAPANAQRGLPGMSFNVLGHVHLGFERLEDQRKEPALIEQH